MAERIDERELGRAIAATARAHHAAFPESDGYDPDWAIWYAAHLQATVWDRLGSIPSRSELTYLFVAADRAYKAAADDRGEWPAFYARFILERFGGG